MAMHTASIGDGDRFEAMLERAERLREGQLIGGEEIFAPLIAEQRMLAPVEVRQLLEAAEAGMERENRNPPEITRQSAAFLANFAARLETNPNLPAPLAARLEQMR